MLRRHLVRGSKRMVRDRMGFLSPVKCPRCRVSTRQTQVSSRRHKGPNQTVVMLTRKCLSCKTEFTQPITPRLGHGQYKTAKTMGEGAFKFSKVVRRVA